MTVNFRYTPTFERQFKRYKKKFPSIENDLKYFIADFEKSAKSNLGGGFYKYRLAVKSKNTGKSGGFRIVTFEIVVSENLKNAVLVTIYDKSEISAVTVTEIRKILNDKY